MRIKKWPLATEQSSTPVMKNDGDWDWDWSMSHDHSEMWDGGTWFLLLVLFIALLVAVSSWSDSDSWDDVRACRRRKRSRCPDDKEKESCPVIDLSRIPKDDETEAESETLTVSDIIDPTFQFAGFREPTAREDLSGLLLLRSEIIPGIDRQTTTVMYGKSDVNGIANGRPAANSTLLVQNASNSTAQFQAHVSDVFDGVEFNAWILAIRVTSGMFSTANVQDGNVINVTEQV